MPTARQVLLQLFADHDVQVEPSSEARRQAEAWALAPEIDDHALDDLTGFPFVTLDSKHAMDLDQALHVEPRGAGYRVRYAIADASHYVAPGTPLWDDALRRGSSYYLPGIVAPMLPRVLSEDVVSLNPNVDRRSVVFVHDLDADGVCTHTEIVRARIRSRAKLGFAESQTFLDGGPAPRGSTEIATTLSALRDVGTVRIQLADSRGVVRFRRSEVQVVATDGTPQFTARESGGYACEDYNEQLSLLCNVEGAKLLQRPAPEGLVQPIYRAHAAPTKPALDNFARLAHAIARVHNKPKTWRWDRETSLASYLANLPSEGEDGRLAKMIHRQALMVGGRAEYVEEPSLHHGIGAAAYARFSAPMREIVGVFCHDELLEGLAGVERSGGGVSDVELREQVVASATRSRTVQKRLERAANRLVIDELLGDGARHLGTLMGLGRGKAHVKLDAPPIDLKVYVRHLEGEAGELRVGRDGVRLFAGKDPVLTVGQRVIVEPAGRDERTDRWRLRCRPAEA
jgi:ribonuclease R